MEQFSDVHVVTPTHEQTPDPVWTGETLFLRSGDLHLEVRVNGRARVSIVMSQNGEPLLVDAIEVVSVSARTKAVEALPEEVRDVGARLLERAAVEVLRVKPQEEGQSDAIQGRAVTFPDPEPWPEAVDGADLLKAIADTYTRLVSLPEGAADALALFVTHTYVHDAAYVSPLLALVSPEKGCGKTTALSVTAELVRRPLSASNITAAALFRTVEKLEPTLLVDEADSFLRDNDELRGILNSGHNKAGAHVIRLVGDTFEPRVFSTWCPKAIATIGKLPPTPMDRAIVIPMRL